MSHACQPWALHRVLRPIPLSKHTSLDSHSAVLKSKRLSFNVQFATRASDFAMSENVTSVETTNIDMDPDQQPEADLDPASTKLTDHKAKKGLPKKRDTHFLCFPLVTDDSIPQLANSLRYFREIATKASVNVKAKPSNSNNDPASENEATPEPQTSMDGNSVMPEANVNLSQPLPSLSPDLQILPAVAHRPPGTFHLTLGVMDLSKKDEMDRALELLQELDYAEIFSTVLAPDNEDDRRLAQPKPSQQTTFQPSDEPEQGETEISSLKRSISPPPVVNTDRHYSNFNKDQPLQISLTGLSTFPSSKSSRVFFAKPSPTSPWSFPLLRFGQAIRRKFREAGFITETRPLVLHATLANMRYATQAKGGRTSKGKTWRYGKARWQDGQVDARELIKLFDQYNGEVEAYKKGTATSDEQVGEFIWARDIILNRVAICKMGAEKSDDDVLGMIYPPLGEKKIFS